MRKFIPGYEGLYQADTDGNIWSVARVVNTWYGGQRKKELLLKGRLNRSGYYVISLSRDGNPKSYIAHRLVFKTFKKLPKYLKSNGRLQINHKDGNKLNNKLENLEVVTLKQNIKHAVDNGLFVRNRTGG